MLAEELNIFFTRLDITAPEAAQLHHTAPSSMILTLEEHEVRRTLRVVNPGKVAGLDGVPGHVLRDCADQLTGTFTTLAQTTVPPCLKSSTIVPLPKKQHIISFNDYRQVALTPVRIKCFEKLVRSLDFHQFAYRVNRSMKCSKLVVKLCDLGLPHTTCM